VLLEALGEPVVVTHLVTFLPRGRSPDTQETGETAPV
jgi:hypothetical protein